MTVPVMKALQFNNKTQLTVTEGVKLKCVLSKSRNVKDVVKSLMAIPNVRQAIIDDISEELGNAKQKERLCVCLNEKGQY